MIPKHEKIKEFNACNSSLTLSLFRCARDTCGEDCIVRAHPAQVCAWELLGIYLGDSSFNGEEIERQKSYWLGVHPVADNSLPVDCMVFSRDGQQVGIIRTLAIPAAYA